MLLLVEGVVAFFVWGILTLAILWHPIELVEEARSLFAAHNGRFGRMSARDLRCMTAALWPFFLLAIAVGFIQHAFFPKRVSNTEKKP